MGFDLNETWELCLKMWKWISKQKDNVGYLKNEWMRNNKFNVSCDCFFCEYDEQARSCFPNSNLDSCNFCPGRLINPKFDCCNKKYHYYFRPQAFYKKLLELYEIYKSKLQ